MYVLRVEIPLDGDRCTHTEALRPKLQRIREAIRAELEPPDPGAFGPDAAPGEAAFAGEPACRESRRSSSPSPSSDLLFLH